MFCKTKLAVGSVQITCEIELLSSFSMNILIFYCSIRKYLEKYVFLGKLIKDVLIKKNDWTCVFYNGISEST